MANENKVEFGFKNVHVAFIESYNAEIKKYTYGDIKPIPGGINISLDPSGDETEFYADDIKYFFQAANTGYQGDVEMARLPPWFRQEALGEMVDSQGIQWESADGKLKEFAMMFEINGDVTGTRFIFPRCKLTRPSITAETVGSTISPSTKTMTLSAMPRENDSRTVGFIPNTDETKVVYDAWFKKVHEPAFKTGAEALSDAVENETQASWR